MKKRGFQWILLGAIVVMLAGCLAKSQQPQQIEGVIRINQIGYMSQANKQAVVIDAQTDSFLVVSKSGKIVFRGLLLDQKFWDKSGENVSIADFSQLKETGDFQLISGSFKSPFFKINTQPFTELLKASIKAYYYNRASTALDEKHAGIYQRGFAHPDTAIYLHASASSSFRPAGSVISAPFGWYDAGDYNKYVVNSSITMYSMLLAYEQNKTLFDSLVWNIPESENNLPDLIDELMWNVSWMEEMQDPSDGGVYHKTTTASFESFMTAEKAHSKRYVVAKSTAATLDFAAVFARLSVSLKFLNPQKSQDYLSKAERAWVWAQHHPKDRYQNAKTNMADGPAISTGEYGDNDLEDEFFWAAVELFAATQDNKYIDFIHFEAFDHFGVPTWSQVESLGLITLASGLDLDVKLKKAAADEILQMAESLSKERMNSPYKITNNEFVWGSNAVVLNQALILINAYKLFGNKEFYDAALSDLDYILGKNATNYCFVTGFGTISPKNIHHRQSATDGIAEPIPGFLVGGPNPRNVDADCGSSSYPTLLPAKCYIDETCSYSTNEVAINWNAPLVYVTSSLQTIYQNDFENL